MKYCHLRRTATAMALLLAIANTAFTQEPPATSIVSDGTGTVYLAPSHLSFWLHFPLPEGDLEHGLAAATAQEVALREYLGAKELASTFDIYPPRVISLGESTSQFSVELRFSMAGLVGGDTGAAKFGALCEAVKSLAGEFGCSVSEPDLLVAENTIAIQDAVQEATKQAFIAASGAASALGATIQAVEKIRINKVTWNDPPDTQAAYPNIELIACTATVTVTYGIQ